MIDDSLELIECANVPKTIHAVITSDLNLAKLHELDTVYGLEDLWRFLEVITVHNYNQHILNKQSEA